MKLLKDKDYAYEVAESFLDFKKVKVNYKSKQRMIIEGEKIYKTAEGTYEAYNVIITFYKKDFELLMKLRFSNASFPMQKQALEWSQEYMTMLN